MRKTSFLKGLPMLCNECPKRAVCSSLCPEAELYASQDEVAQRELPVGLPKYSVKIQWGVSIHLTKMEREILTLLARGLSREDICKTLDISRNTLRVHLRNAKKKH